MAKQIMMALLVTLILLTFVPSFSPVQAAGPGWPYWDAGIQRWVVTLASGVRLYYYTYAQAVAGYYSWVAPKTILVVPAIYVDPCWNGTYSWTGCNSVQN